MPADNLLNVPETRLPAEPAVRAAIDAASGSADALSAVVAAHPTSSLAWVSLAEAAWDPMNPLEAYAYARVGYHRGLDSLRAAGWKGQGPIPWAHEPNRGILRSLYTLRRAATAIGEGAEVRRLSEFLQDADGSVIGILDAETGASTGDSANPPTEAFVIRGED